MRAAACSALLVAGMANLATLATLAKAREPGCVERIRRAIDAPQDVSDCRLLAEEGGRILAFTLPGWIYLLVRTEPKNTRLELDLRRRTVKSWEGDPTVRADDRFRSPRNLPDAKFLYFPFEKAGRRHNRATGPGEAKWVCLDPRRLSLDAASLKALRC